MSIMALIPNRGWGRKGLLALGLAAIIGLAMPAPASADPPRHRGHGHHDRSWHARDYHGPRWNGPYRYYHPRPVYYTYAPPPVVVYRPPPPPAGISFVFPFHFD